MLSGNCNQVETLCSVCTRTTDGFSRCFVSFRIVSCILEILQSLKMTICFLKSCYPAPFRVMRQLKNVFLPWIKQGWILQVRSCTKVVKWQQQKPSLLIRKGKKWILSKTRLALQVVANLWLVHVGSYACVSGISLLTSTVFWKILTTRKNVCCQNRIDVSASSKSKETDVLNPGRKYSVCKQYGGDSESWESYELFCCVQFLKCGWRCFAALRTYA